MNISENIGKGIGFIIAVTLFSLILSFIRKQFFFQTIVLTILWTAIIVLVLARIQYLIKQQKVEDVS